MWVRGFAIRVCAKLCYVLFKTRVGQILRVHLALHVIVYHFYNCLGLLFFKKLKNLILLKHLPYLRDIYLFLCLELLLFYAERGVLEKEKPPHLAVLPHHVLQVVFIRLLLLFLIIYESNQGHPRHHLLLFHRIVVIQALVLEITFAVRAELYQSFLVHEVFELF
jgi:hypothetical protein